jgi:hypothetical protein
VSPRRTPPAAPYTATSDRRSLLAVGTSRRTEGQFFYSHQEAGILKPSSALLGLIQDMLLDDTYKGREAFSKIEGILREVGARRREALLEAISEAISMVTAQDAKGFFGHCGYHLMDQCL